MDKLKQRGAEVSYYDPYVTEIGLTREHPHWAGTTSVEWTKETITSFDVTLICTAHNAINFSGTGRLVALNHRHP